YKQALQSLQKGDKAKLDNSMGDLVLPKSASIPLVFVAGGIGIASFVGMLKQLLMNQERLQIYFYYQLRDKEEKIYSELLNSYKFERKDIVINPEQVTTEKIKANTPPDSLIYISGSQTFVENLQNKLEASGTPRAQIIFDYYDGYDEL
ncbi:MAG: hypothetical protein ACREHG_04415, partial [Candidatus Saccharimonadales bacterium]